MEQQADGTHEAVVAAIKTCYDPEIPVDIYELGLIYDIKIEDGFAKITMTLTSPMCPVAEILPGEVEEKVRTTAGVSGAEIDLVWDPPWDPSMMSEAARLQLGF
jgi:FeS assembly SUF system protein